MAAFEYAPAPESRDIGRLKSSYQIFVGGRLLGDRLNFIYKDLIPEEAVVPTIVPLFVYFKQDRKPGETFGDFCLRKGADDLLACRHAAQQEAYYATPFTGPTRLYGYIEANRFENESRLTSFCMRNKGYALVTVSAPQTRAPAATDK